MIYQDYEIWTFNGWQRIGTITKSDKIMVFDLRKRMSTFREVGEIKAIIKDKNIFKNTNYDFVFCDENNFLNEDYKIIKPKSELKILCDSRTLWHIEDVLKSNEKVKFYTFHLEPYEFVYVRNVISLYIGWNNETIDKGYKKTAKIKNVS
jgi:hypothetical protein